jgi:hypothetical protein
MDQVLRSWQTGTSASHINRKEAEAMLARNIALILVLFCLSILAAKFEGGWTPYVIGGSVVVYALGTCIMFTHYGMLSKKARGYLYNRFICGVMILGAVFGIIIIVIAALLPE